MESISQSHLTGKINPVEDEDNLPLCIAHIYNRIGKKLCIGVINQNRNVIINLACLGRLRKPKIKFSDGNAQYSTLHLTSYGEHIAEIGVRI